MSNIVDENCQYRDGVICDNYSCTLNQTDIKNNHNKFYIMQVIKKSTGDFCLFVRYGRVGERGVISYPIDNSKDDWFCKGKFETQFKSKTGNNWRKDWKTVPFEVKKGKYCLCEMDIIDVTSNVSDANKSMEVKPIESKLDKRVQDLISIISDVKNMNATMVSLNIDTKKLPLGKLSQTQIDKGYKILNQISEVLLKTNGTMISINENISELSSMYYTLIPYVCKRGQRPPLIDTKELVQKCTETLDELSNITVAATVINCQRNPNEKNPNEKHSYNEKHPIDKVYDQLNTEISPIERDSEIWKIIQMYVENTHAPTHSNYTIDIVDMFEIKRPNDAYKSKYGAFPNRQLLWHGTRLSNFVSILQKGLLLRPDVIPGTYISGKMFGYGIYGANSFSKSFNYTGANHADNEACLFLAEFALGKTSNRTHADYYITKESLKLEGCDSTWGQGIRSPCGYVTIDNNNNTIVPNGKLSLMDRKLPSSQSLQLQYDEFIVYDQDQIDLRFIVRVKGKFK